MLAQSAALTDIAMVGVKPPNHARPLCPSDATPRLEIAAEQEVTDDVRLVRRVDELRADVAVLLALDELPVPGVLVDEGDLADVDL